MHIKKFGLAAIAATALFATACSTPPRRPPATSVELADTAVGRADEGRVGDYAAPELRDAREKLNEARELSRTAQATKDSTAAKHANWLAEESRADADLGVAKAQLARSQEINFELQRDIDRLQPAGTPVGAPMAPENTSPVPADAAPVDAPKS